MLTDVEIRALRPAERAYKRGDDKGRSCLSGQPEH